MLRGSFTRRAKARAINYLHVLTIDAEKLEQVALEFPGAYRFIRKWIGWRSLTNFLLDRLRRYKRSMTLLIKRWVHLRPRIFIRMRCFMLTLYLLLKGQPHEETADAHFPHRGRLRLREKSVASLSKRSMTTSAASTSSQSASMLAMATGAPGGGASHVGGGASLAVGAGVEAAVARLNEIHSQLSALLAEQARLSAHVAECALSEPHEAMGMAAMPAVAAQSKLAPIQGAAGVAPQRMPKLSQAVA